MRGLDAVCETVELSHWMSGMFFRRSGTPLPFYDYHPVLGQSQAFFFLSDASSQFFCVEATSAFSSVYRESCRTCEPNLPSLAFLCVFPLASSSCCEILPLMYFFVLDGAHGD